MQKDQDDGEVTRRERASPESCCPDAGHDAVQMLQQEEDKEEGGSTGPRKKSEECIEAHRENEERNFNEDRGGGLWCILPETGLTMQEE